MLYMLMANLDITKKFSYSENSQLLEQPPQWHSGIPIAGGFSNAVAQVIDNLIWAPLPMEGSAW